MEFGFPGHVLTLDSILEGILQDESTSSSSSDSSRPTHLSLDNIPDALPIKEEKMEGNTVDIMVRFLFAQNIFGHSKPNLPPKKIMGTLGIELLKTEFA